MFDKLSYSIQQILLHYLSTEIIWLLMINHILNSRRQIVSLMLRDQNASQLAKSGLQRSVTEKEKDEATLLSARLKEKEKKTERIRKYASAR